MAITDYIKSCGYSLGSLKDYVYLFPKKDSKILYHASDKTVNVEKITGVIQKLECRGVTLSETQTLDSRFAFESEVKLTFDETWMDTFHDVLEYIRHNPCYIIIETTEGVQFLTNIELHTKYTYDYTFTDSEGEGIYAVLTFTNTSNTPLLRIANDLIGDQISIATSEWKQLTENVAPPIDESGIFYESFSNYHVGNGRAKMRVTFKGIPNFKIYYRSEAQSSYDYVIISKLDTELPSDAVYNSSSVAAFSRNYQRTWRNISFSNDGGEHFIEVVYLKNDSTDTGLDKGFIFIPNKQEGINEIKTLIGKLCDYSICKVSHLLLSPKGSIITNNGNLTSDDQYKVEWLPDTFNYTEEYNGEYFRQILSFSIPLNDYQDYWEYRLSEFNDNRYCAVLQTFNGNFIVLGLQSPLVPTYEIETSETIDTPNLITITFECYSSNSVYVSNMFKRWVDSGMFNCTDIEEYNCFRIVDTGEYFALGNGEYCEKLMIESAYDCENFRKTDKYVIGNKIDDPYNNDNIPDDQLPNKFVKIDLTNEWCPLTFDITPPTGVEGTIYESFSNWFVNDSGAIMTITFKGLPSFTIYYRHDGDTLCYTMISKIDTQIFKLDTRTSNNVQDTTYNYNGRWKSYTYNNDGGEHFIKIVFRNEFRYGSFTSPDTGFIMIPKDILDEAGCKWKVKWIVTEEEFEEY